MRMRGRIILSTFVIFPAIHADEWPGPQIREVFSHSRNYFVRVNPGKSWGDTYGFKGAAKGPFATAEFYRVETDRSYRLTATANLLNPVAPVDFFVTDRGVLITLDNWHNMGYGSVVAFYAADGQPIRSYALSDLFTKTEVEGFRQSVSSIWWRKSTAAYIREDQETFNITVNDTGSAFIFEVASGAYQYCENRNGGYSCRTSNMPRAWKAYVVHRGS
jgi:hypothetical protein